MVSNKVVLKNEQSFKPYCLLKPTKMKSATFEFDYFDLKFEIYTIF